MSGTSDKIRDKTFTILEAGSEEEIRDAVFEETVLFTLPYNLSFCGLYMLHQAFALTGIIPVILLPSTFLLFKHNIKIST
jgi:hypothetical protein